MRIIDVALDRANSRKQIFISTKVRGIDSHVDHEHKLKLLVLERIYITIKIRRNS